MITKIYLIFGKILSVVGWPIVKILMLGSTRVYLLVEFNGQILVLKTWLSLQSRWKLMPKTQWRLPGGGVNKSEDLKSAVLRELKEEIGLILNSSDITQINKQSFRSDWNFDYYIFKASINQKPKLKPNHYEIVDYMWLDIKKANSYPCNEELQYALRHCF